MTGQFAQGTDVAPERSQQEIVGTLRRYGAQGFAFAQEGAHAMVAFRADDRQVRFVIRIPDASDRRFATTPAGRARTREQIESARFAEEKRLWRALALGIKAKLEVVSSGIATFEEEFLAHVVLPDGTTVGASVTPAVEQAYATGEVRGLLAIEGRAS